MQALGAVNVWSGATPQDGPYVAYNAPRGQLVGFDAAVLLVSCISLSLCARGAYRLLVVEDKVRVSQVSSESKHIHMEVNIFAPMCLCRVNAPC